MPEGDVEAGTRYFVNALRGFGARHHFDLYHPDQVERGVEEAPAEALAHDEWMYGYRFVERKGAQTTGSRGSTESDGKSRESDGTRSEWVPLVMRKEPTDV